MLSGMTQDKAPTPHNLYGRPTLYSGISGLKLGMKFGHVVKKYMFGIKSLL